MVSWKVIALLFVQIVRDTEKYQKYQGESREPESHHLEANFGKFFYCKDSIKTLLDSSLKA